MQKRILAIVAGLVTTSLIVLSFENKVVDTASTQVHEIPQTQWLNSDNYIETQTVLPKKPRKIAITYADGCCEHSSIKHCQTAVNVGGLEECAILNRTALDSDFLKENSDILSQKRGAGYWLWKPYLILKTLQSLEDGDFLMYADAGSEYIGDIAPLYQVMDSEKRDYLFFRLKYKHGDWAKRDAFVLTNCDYDSCYNQLQLNGAFHLWRKSAESIRFVEQWLEFCKDPRILTDMPNQMGKPDLPGFKENRHDQTVLTIVAFLNNVTSHRDPSHYNTEDIQKNWAESPYGILFQHTKDRT